MANDKDKPEDPKDDKSKDEKDKPDPKDKQDQDKDKDKDKDPKPDDKSKDSKEKDSKDDKADKEKDQKDDKGQDAETDAGDNEDPASDSADADNPDATTEPSDAGDATDPASEGSPDAEVATAEEKKEALTKAFDELSNIRDKIVSTSKVNPEDIVAAEAIHPGILMDSYPSGGYTRANLHVAIESFDFRKGLLLTGVIGIIIGIILRISAWIAGSFAKASTGSTSNAAKLETMHKHNETTKAAVKDIVVKEQKIEKLVRQVEGDREIDQEAVRAKLFAHVQKELEGFKRLVGPEHPLVHEIHLSENDKIHALQNTHKKIIDNFITAAYNMMASPLMCDLMNSSSGPEVRTNTHDALYKHLTIANLLAARTVAAVGKNHLESGLQTIRDIRDAKIPKLSMIVSVRENRDAQLTEQSQKDLENAFDDEHSVPYERYKALDDAMRKFEVIEGHPGQHFYQLLILNQPSTFYTLPPLRNGLNQLLNWGQHAEEAAKHIDPTSILADRVKAIDANNREMAALNEFMQKDHPQDPVARYRKELLRKHLEAYQKDLAVWQDIIQMCDMVMNGALHLCTSIKNIAKRINEYEEDYLKILEKPLQKPTNV